MEQNSCWQLKICRKVNAQRTAGLMSSDFATMLTEVSVLLIIENPCSLVSQSVTTLPLSLPGLA